MENINKDELDNDLTRIERALELLGSFFRDFDAEYNSIQKGDGNPSDDFGMIARILNQRAMQFEYEYQGKYTELFNNPAEVDSHTVKKQVTEMDPVVGIPTAIEKAKSDNDLRDPYGPEIENLRENYEIVLRDVEGLYKEFREFLEQQLS